MEELIKYFESLEQRLSAIEAAHQDLSNKLLTIGEHVASMVKTLDEVQHLHPAAAPNDNDVVLAQRLAILAERVEAIEAALEAEQPKQVVEPEPVAVPEPVVEPEPEPEIIPTPEPEPEPIVEPEPTVEPEPVASSQQPIAEPTPVQASLFGQPVENIRQAISLGDRFLFQRELFAQNGEKMQKALDELDKLGSMDEAMSYIDKHFQWDKESSTYELFLNVLRRRFN